MHFFVAVGVVVFDGKVEVSFVFVGQLYFEIAVADIVAIKETTNLKLERAAGAEVAVVVIAAAVATKIKIDYNLAEVT
jgi:hypothetical protein